MLLLLLLPLPLPPSAAPVRGGHSCAAKQPTGMPAREVKIMPCRGWLAKF